MRKLEICCYSIESAIIAQKAGAHRIELCDNYLEGGTTASFGTIKNALKHIKIPINVIVRPRGGDFLYTKLEFETIKDDVLKIKELGANGVVIGFLTTDGAIDINKTEEIVKLADGLDVTFHRAFDMCKNPFDSIKPLYNVGVKRILTSGQNKTAIQGLENLSKLVEIADNKIIIMPGAGINDENIKELMLKTNAQEFHCSAKTFSPSFMNYKHKESQMGSNKNYDEYMHISTNSEMIKKILKTINPL